LDNQWVQAAAVEQRFALWSDVGVGVVCAASLALMGLASYIALRPAGHWHQASVYIVGLALLVNLSAVLIPPFTFAFREGFILVDNGTFVGKDDGFRSSVESMIGIGFASVAFTWFANVFVFVLHSIVPGVFVACAVFWLQEADRSSRIWWMQRGRLVVLLWLAHSLLPVAGLLAVVIVYQVRSPFPLFIATDSPKDSCSADSGTVLGWHFCPMSSADCSMHPGDRLLHFFHGSRMPVPVCSALPCELGLQPCGFGLRRVPNGFGLQHCAHCNRLAATTVSRFRMVAHAGSGRISGLGCHLVCAVDRSCPPTVYVVPSAPRRRPPR